MNTFLRALGLAAGLALSALAGVANAVTVASTGIGSTFSIGYSQTYIDNNNPGGVSLSATSDWTLTGYSATSTTATWTFDVLVSNTTLATALGTNRLASWGFDTTPSSSAGNGTPATGWFYASGTVPSGLGSYDVCVKSGGGTQNCGGNGSGGIAEGGSQLFSIVIDTALANPLTFNNFFVRYQGVGAGSNGSTAFTGAEIPPVPLPPAGLALLAGIGALAAVRRRRRPAA